MTFVISDTAMIVEYRKNKKMTQAEVAIKMATTQSAVARLEKRLLNGEDVMLSALQRYSSALGLDLQWAIRPKNGRWELHLHLPPSIMKGGGQPGRTTILRTVFLVLRHRQKIADRFNRTPYCADIYWPLARPTCSGG